MILYMILFLYFAYFLTLNYFYSLEPQKRKLKSLLYDDETETGTTATTLSLVSAATSPVSTDLKQSVLYGCSRRIRYHIEDMCMGMV